VTVPEGNGAGAGDADQKAGEGTQDADAAAKAAAGAGGDKADKGAEKTFTQAELDDIIGKRLARAQKDWQQKADEDVKKAAMTEGEKLKTEKEEAEKKAKDAEAAAGKRAVRAEAKLQALAAGIKTERLDHALKLADLAEITVGDDGEPDANAVKKAIDAVVKDFPEIVTPTVGASKGGSDFSGGSKDDKALSETLIAEMSAEELKRRMPEIRAFYENKKK
jgi:hypothetical protein